MIKLTSTIKRLEQMSPLERLGYFVTERQKIYEKKEARKPKPWTDDAILQTEYFCNIRREQDKTTKWVREYIREPLQGKDEVAFAVLAFRWFNLIETGNALLDSRHGPLRTESMLHSLLCKWNPRKAKERLQGLPQIFTGAFTISPSGSSKPKLDRVIDDYIQPVWESKPPIGNVIKGCLTLRSAFNVVSTFPGFGGGFMAAQVIADLRYTHLLHDALDSHTWCCLGPGSLRGLHRIAGRSIEAPKPADWHEEMVVVQRYLNTLIKPVLHMTDVQNCLCEYFKYERVLFQLGSGRSKRKYNGTI